MNCVLDNDVMAALESLQRELTETEWDTEGGITNNNPVGCSYGCCDGSGHCTNYD